MFENVRYDLYASDTRVIISGIRGEAEGKTVKITLSDNGGTLYVNNTEAKNVSREGNYVTVELPLGKCVVEMK